MKIKKIFNKALLVGLITLTLINITTPFTLASNDDWFYVRRKKNNCEMKTTPVSDIDLSSVSQGDHLTPGSFRYQVAQQVFDTLTKDLGFSGVAAAGIMGNIVGESGFVPDAAERGDWSRSYPNEMGGVLRFGMLSKVAPEGAWGWQGPSTRATGYFGGGLIQFTPYTRFTNSTYWLDDKGWDPRQQMLFMWEEEFANRMIEMYMSSSSSSYGAGHYGLPPVFNTVEEFISTNDISKAADAFQVGYERPKDFHPERRVYAAQINAVFNKDNIQADPSKWVFKTGNSSVGINELIGNNSALEDPCKNGLTSSDFTDADVQLLLQQVGKQYILGHAGPDIFDCSGLVKWFYEKKGLKLFHGAKTQSYFGDDVPTDQLQPGDLMFFSTDGSGDISHVGFYIGNDTLVHAANEEIGVMKMENITKSNFFKTTFKFAKRYNVEKMKNDGIDYTQQRN